jgi:hypothetical protein
MGFRGRIKKLERATEGEVATLVCPACGEEFVVYGDAALEYLGWAWEQGSGSETYRQTPADVIRLTEHEHDPSEFVDKATGEPFVGKLFRGTGEMMRADVPDLSEQAKDARARK